MSPPLMRLEAIEVRRRLLETIMTSHYRPELLETIRAATPDETDCAFRWVAHVLSDLVQGNGAWSGNPGTPTRE